MKLHKKSPNHFFIACLLLCLCMSFIFIKQSNAYEFYNWNRWFVGYEMAMLEAKEKGSPLILYFYLNEDEWSEKMNNEYIADDKVDKFLRDIPKAAIDVNYSDQEKELAKGLEVVNCPAFLISIPSLETKYQRIHPFSDKGNMTIDEFIGEIKTFITYHYNMKAHSFFEKKEYEKALELFEKSIEFDPENPYTYRAIGVLYHTMAAENNDRKLLKMAEENYQKVIELDPKNKEVREELEKLTKGHP